MICHGSRSDVRRRRHYSKVYVGCLWQRHDVGRLRLHLTNSSAFRTSSHTLVETRCPRRRRQESLPVITWGTWILRVLNYSSHVRVRYVFLYFCRFLLLTWIVLFTYWIQFTASSLIIRYYFCRAMLCISAIYAVARCLSVCPSVRPVRVFSRNE